jgi:WD40 repeat protein
MSKPDERPQYRLSRVYSDGAREDFALLPVTSMSMGVTLDRRQLFGTGIAVSSVLTGLTGCGTPKRTANPQPPPPAPVPTLATTSGPLRAHKGPVSGLALTPDGKTVVTAGQDDELKVWPFHPASTNHRSEGLRTTRMAFKPCSSRRMESASWLLPRISWRGSRSPHFPMAARRLTSAAWMPRHSRLRRLRIRACSQSGRKTRPSCTR